MVADALAPIIGARASATTMLNVIMLNSLRPRDAYMHQWTRPSLLHTLHISKHIEVFLHSASSHQRSLYLMLFIIQNFKKMHLKILSVKWRPFCLGLSMLMTISQHGKLLLSIISDSISFPLWLFQVSACPSVCLSVYPSWWCNQLYPCICNIEPELW